MIEDYSTINGKIFNVLPELISIYEGERYVLKELTYNKYFPEISCSIILILKEDDLNRISSPSSNNRAFYVTATNIANLIENDYALKIMHEEWCSCLRLPKVYTFYKANNIGKVSLEPQIKFKTFPYLKKFIDYVINYKIENNIKDLTETDIHMLKDNFIILNFKNSKHECKILKKVNN